MTEYVLRCPHCGWETRNMPTPGNLHEAALEAKKAVEHASTHPKPAYIEFIRVENGVELSPLTGKGRFVLREKQ